MDYLKGMSKEQMKLQFESTDTDILDFFSEQVAERFEKFEICQAIKEELEERKLLS